MRNRLEMMMMIIISKILITLKAGLFFSKESMFVTFFLIVNSYGMIDEDVEDNTVCCLGLIESKIWHFLFGFLFSVAFERVLITNEIPLLSSKTP